MAEHRVPLLGAALRRYPDPTRSRDPKVRELVSALATLDVAPPIDDDFRAELRAQLIAVTPRLVEEGERDGAPPRAARATRQAAPEPKRRRRVGRRLAVAAGVLVAFVLLLGGAVLVSHDALPGDTLYGLKRASEDTQYGLTGGAVAKGDLKLQFAARRIGEVGDLLPRPSALRGGTGAVAGGGLNDATVSLIRDTLGSADGDITTAAQLLGTTAVQTRQPGPLNTMIAWAPRQLTAMQAVVSRIPSGPARQAARATWSLIVDARARATTLRSELRCGCLATSTSDRLGPLPCRSGCTATGGRNTGPSSGPSGGRTGGSTSTRTPSGGRPGTGSTRSGTSGGGAGGTGRAGGTSGTGGTSGRGGAGGSGGSGGQTSGSTRTGSGGGGLLPTPGKSGLLSPLPTVSVSVGVHLGGSSSSSKGSGSGGGGAGSGGGGGGGGVVGGVTSKVPVAVSSTCVGAGVGGVGVGVGCS